MTVLVLTSTTDVTADRVIAELNRRGAPVVRMDLADFPARVRISAGLGPAGWSGRLVTEHRDIALESVRAVYYRRPAPFGFPETMPEPHRRWCADEARDGLGGLLTALPHARWINPPGRMAAASKPVQLATAATCGLALPATLVTNNPARARDFVAAHEQLHSGTIYKAFTGPPQSERSTALFTTPVGTAEITDGVAATAHMFQQRIRKTADVRVTEVDGELFAVRIETGSVAATADFRSDYRSLTYSPITLPHAVADGLRRLTHRLGLIFGAHDLLETEDGLLYYLETNPNGQWGWLAETAPGIAPALARALMIGETH